MATTTDEVREVDEPETPDTQAEPESPDVTEEEDQGADELEAEPFVQPPPPPPGPSPEEMEKRFQAAERAATAYAKKIGDIFEEQAVDLLPCPLCPDMHKGFVNIHDAGRMPEGVKDSVKAYLGYPREQEYNQDPDTRTCPKCDGRGKTRTGSTVPGNESRKCPACAGFGYLPPPTAQGAPAPMLDNGHHPAGEHPVAVSAADVDTMGEPRYLPDGRENPNYGKWPQYKVEVAPWGATAGLTAQDAAAA